MFLSPAGLCPSCALARVLVAPVLETSRSTVFSARRVAARRSAHRRMCRWSSAPRTSTLGHPGSCFPAEIWPVAVTEN